MLIRGGGSTPTEFTTQSIFKNNTNEQPGNAFGMQDFDFAQI